MPNPHLRPKPMDGFIGTCALWYGIRLHLWNYWINTSIMLQWLLSSENWCHYTGNIYSRSFGCHFILLSILKLAHFYHLCINYPSFHQCFPILLVYKRKSYVSHSVEPIESSKRNQRNRMDKQKAKGYFNNDGYWTRNGMPINS